MKRRSFFSMFAALVAAPLALVKASKETVKVPLDDQGDYDQGDWQLPDGSMIRRFPDKHPIGEGINQDGIDLNSLVVAKARKMGHPVLKDQLIRLKVKQTQLLSKWGST